MLLFYLQATAQNPPQLSANNIDFKWSVPIVDSNFVKEELDIFSSMYWGFNFLQMQEYEDDLILLNGTRTQSPYGGVDGCLVHSIEKNTGVINWIHHNNINSGNTRRSYYNLTALSLQSDDQLYLLGLTDLDSLRKDIPTFSFRAQPKMKIIDINTGLLLASQKGDEDLSSYFNFSISVFPHRNTKGDVFGLAPVPKRENNLNYKTFEFTSVDSSLNFQLPYLTDARVLMTDSTAGLPFSPSSMYPINKDSLLLFYYDPYFEDLTLSPQGIFVQVVDVGTLDEVQVVEQFYIDENIYYPQPEISGAPIFPQVIDNTIIVTQRPYVDISQSLDRFIWLHWYDLAGNMIAYVPVAGELDPFDLIYPVGIRNDRMYFLGERDDIFSVCYLEEGAEDLVEIKSFTIDNPEFTDVRISTAKFLTDGRSAFMDISCKYTNENGRDSDYSYMTLVDVSELGITTSALEAESNAEALNIYPNPAVEIIQLDNNHDGVLRIYDNTGRLVQMESCKANAYVNIASLTAGTYTVNLKSLNSSLNEQLVVIR